MKIKAYILLFVTLLLTSCSDTLSALFDGGEMAAGDPVLFTTLVPDAAETRSAKSDWQTKVNAYKPVNEEYTFMVDMYKNGAETPTATSYYGPITDYNTIVDYDGTLEHRTHDAESNAYPAALYWQDNVNEWGFKAETVSSASIEADQSTQEKWLYQDYLTGHSYLPQWTGDDESGSGTDPETIVYKTSKQWYAGNKAIWEANGQMPTSTDDYKKIPLYMKHQRAWITIILKAGEGVKREALSYYTAEENIHMTINSFSAGSSGAFQITKPWARIHYVDYAKDANGGAEQNVVTTRYEAIVEPHNYATKKDEEVIAKINLSSQNFSFYASNDTRYLSGTDAAKAEADNAYNLEAGKHLTIEATLSRESRKILITAWIEDWTEVATQTICDDYGQNGDPIVIKNRKELIDFLTDPTVNKQGSVGIIQPTELNLDVENETTEDGKTYPANWPGYELKATLNLAGCVLKTKHQLFTTMASSANLVNGSVLVEDGATVKYAIADYNDGTIERVNVTTTSELTTARATVAGMVGKNCGTIYQCTSTLPVYATESPTIASVEGDVEYKGYIGGIAAVSKSHDGSSMAVIDGCTVNASVNSSNSVVKGGGIVGYATGRVSNNTFEYGITVSQNITNFKNIFAQAGNTDTRAYGNSWPTTALNYINESDKATNPNNYQGMLYYAVLDCQAELDKVMNDATYNAKGQNIRVSKSFSVESTNDNATDWTHGTVNAKDVQPGVNNVSFNLYGNEKTITLTGTKTVTTTSGTKPDEGTSIQYTTAPMLFNCILGEVRDLTIYLDKPIVATPTLGTGGLYNAEDANAPLAYAVYGQDAKVTNVKVKAKANTSSEQKDGAYVQSSTPAGLVVWAYGESAISNCTVKVPVRMWLPTNMGNDAKHYAGGIVACAAKATITECTYMGNTENSVSGSDYSTSAKQSANYYYGGIVGGTSIKDNEKPALTITDCTSWYLATRATDQSADKTSKGGIIGYSCYADNDGQSTIRTGMKEGNQGNWWQLSAVGAHTWATGMTEEKVIGKRNSVTPIYDQYF